MFFIHKQTRVLKEGYTIESRAGSTKDMIHHYHGGLTVLCIPIHEHACTCQSYRGLWLFWLKRHALSNHQFKWLHEEEVGNKQKIKQQNIKKRKKQNRKIKKKKKHKQKQQQKTKKQNTT